jgi:hypothetical protein
MQVGYLFLLCEILTYKLNKQLSGAVFHEKQIFYFQLVRNFFMKVEGSLLYLQEPAIGPYYELHESGLEPLPPNFLKIHFNIILLSTPSSEWYSPITLIKILYAYVILSIRATCFAHAMPVDLSFLTIGVGYFVRHADSRTPHWPYESHKLVINT